MVTHIIPGMKRVSSIFHISDVHIRLFKRADEYKKVFISTIEYIKKHYDIEESLIVISGDLIHTKLDLSPEMIQITNWFLKKLSDITNVIIIPGQHDCNLNNNKRLDAITPIIENLGRDNIHYFKFSGLYQIGDCIFSPMSIFDDPSKYFTAEKIPVEYQNYIKIAMFHGTVDTALLDNEYRLSSKTSLEFFDGFDIVLLGDIHKHQILQRFNSDNKKPTMVYPGSLIQQNFGESLENHGILVWDIQKRDFQMVEMPNDYGFVNISVDNGIFNKSELNNIPKNPRIKLSIKNTSATQLKDVLIEIRQKYTPEEVSLNRVGSSIQRNEELQKLDLKNIRNVDFQNKLIEDYLRTNCTIDSSIIDKILQINRELNTEIQPSDSVKNAVWKPKLFEFSNMFSYGENNVVDFSKTDGIVGLFSSNASGKCVDENTEIIIEFDEDEIVGWLGFLPDELK
jgi:DNA repair exonuclease SbcCD nuclease subunit